MAAVSFRRAIVVPGAIARAHHRFDSENLPLHAYAALTCPARFPFTRRAFNGRFTTPSSGGKFADPGKPRCRPSRQDIDTAD